MSELGMELLASWVDGTTRLLVTWTILATIVVGIAVMAERLLCHASAAIRHSVWWALLASLLLYPVALLVVPGAIPPNFARCLTNVPRDQRPPTKDRVQHPQAPRPIATAPFGTPLDRSRSQANRSDRCSQAARRVCRPICARATRLPFERRNHRVAWLGKGRASGCFFGSSVESCS